MSEHFPRLVQEVGVTCTQSRVGNVRGTAVSECLFSTLQFEHVHRRHNAPRNVTPADAFDFMQRLCGSTRRYSTLEYMSPLNEQSRAVAQLTVYESWGSSKRHLHEQNSLHVILVLGDYIRANLSDVNESMSRRQRK